MTVTAQDTFEAWFARVDRIITAKVGVGANDLPDQSWRDWFDDGLTAKEAAQMALENEM